MKISIKQFLVLIILLPFGLIAQKVEVIYESFKSEKINSVCFAKNGDLLLAGRYTDEVPYLARVDTNGNLLWEYIYPDILPPLGGNDNYTFEFLAVASDDSGYIYVTGHRRERGENEFVLKLDSTGNHILWKITGISNSIHIMYERGEYLYEVHHSNIVLRNKIDGTVYITNPHSAIGNLYIYQGAKNNHIFKNGKWWLSTFTGILTFDTLGNNEMIELVDGDFGRLIEVGDSGYKTFLTRKDESVSLNVIKHMFQIILKNHEETSSTEFNLTRDKFNIYDTLSCFMGNIISHKNKGYVGISMVAKGWNPSIGSGWFFQYNENHEIVYDTIFHNSQYQLNHLNSYNNTIIAVGATGGAGYGIRMYKINLPDIDTYPSTSTNNLKTTDSKTQVFPNPSSSGNFEIRSENKIKEVRVYALNGSLVLQQNVNAEQTSFVLAEQGVYIVQLQFANGEFETAKVVKL